MAKRFSVICLRHGESEWNKENLFCGWHDVKLSDSGLRDASEVSAGALKREGFTDFDICYTSCLTRANQTLTIILRDLDLDPVIRMDWRLNERHYGALTGFNKRQMAEMYGEKQVQIWRRSFNVFPPPITAENPYYEPIRSNPKFKDIAGDQFPDTETLETTMNRVRPFWTDVVVPQLRDGKKVLIVAHGTSLRGLVKHVKKMTDESAMKFNLPNSIPFILEFDESFNLIGDLKFLADEQTVKSAVDKVAAIGK